MNESWQRYAAAALAGLLANSNNLTAMVTQDVGDYLASLAAMFADKMIEQEDYARARSRGEEL